MQNRYLCLQNRHIKITYKDTFACNLIRRDYRVRLDDLTEQNKNIHKKLDQMLKSCTLLVGLLIVVSLQAQVTIGSLDAPVEGALLDLKEEKIDGANSKKGLMLPRVKLTEPTLLYPMFETTPGSGIAIGDYSTDEKKLLENQRHVGLTVYNLSTCDNKFNKGVYFWNGNKWEQALDLPILGTPSISTNHPNDFIDIPSGLDARVMSSTFNFTATTISNSMTLTTKGEYTKYETLFTPMPWTNGGQKTIDSNTDTYSLQVNSMDDLTSFPSIKPNATKPVYPWYSRQWTLTYTPEANECGVGTPKTIILNQTNYAIKVGDFVNSITYSFYDRSDFGSPKSGSFPVSSNVRWTTDIRGLEDGNLVNVTPGIGTEHGSNRNDGTKEDLAGDFSFTLNLPQTTPKYHKNEVIFKDANNVKLAKDVAVTFVNCTNEEPTLEEWKVRAGVAHLAEGVAHPVSTIAWHKDQGGRTFFSADFGSAGRWMINNLAVDKYDPNRSDGSTIGPRDILERRYLLGTAPEVAYEPSYVFPTDQASEIADIDDDVIFQTNQRYGYMYNWSAISKNRDVIFDVQAPDPITGDTGHRYMDLPSEIGTDQAKVQGICPYGWHLPSDKDWTILENEIIHNTSLYSSTSNMDPSNENRFDPNNTTTDREKLIPHGLPMKDMCQPYGDFLASQPEGTRFKPTQGTSNIMSPTTRAGFNLLLPGVASTKAGGSISFFGWMANYWSSSIINKGQVMGRLMQYTTDVMTRGQVAKSTLLPVRCIKDK